MKRKLISLFSVAFAFGTCLSACDNTTSKRLTIELYDNIATAYTDKEYDFGKYIKQEAGVDYSISCYYQDYYRMKEHEVMTNGLSFTPTEDFDVSVVVKAKLFEQVAYRTVSVPVQKSGDPLDELFVSGGYSGWSDDGFYKDMCDDEEFIHGSESNTSILCSYQGNNAYVYGGVVLTLHNFRCFNYYSDTTWEDAIVTLWVYNPTASALHFSTRIVDKYLTNGVDLDWGQPGNIIQTAEPGKWTQLFFPLALLGINHTLIEDEGDRRDQLNIKVKWDGIPAAVNGIIPYFTYKFYMDDIDVVPSEDYPEIDTRVCDPVEQELTMSWFDNTSMTRVGNFDTNYVIDGESSLLYEFNGYERNESGVQIACLNADKINTLWSDTEFKNSILTASIYNDSDLDIEFALRVKDDKSGLDMDWGNSLNVVQVAKSKQWTQLFWSLNKLGINYPLIKNESTINLGYDQQLTIKARYAGRGGGSVKYSFKFYLDKLDIVTASTYPDVDTKAADPIERSLLEYWSEECLVKSYNFDNNFIKSEDGNSSLKISYSGNQLFSAGVQAVTLNNIHMLKYWEVTNWEDAVLSFWVYNPNSKELQFQLRLKHDGDNSIDVDWVNNSPLQQVVAANSWGHIMFSLKDFGITCPLYKGLVEELDTVEHKDEFSIKCKYDGAKDGINYSYSFYIDELEIADASKFIANTSF